MLTKLIARKFVNSNVLFRDFLTSAFIHFMYHSSFVGNLWKQCLPYERVTKIKRISLTLFSRKIRDDFSQSSTYSVSVAYWRPRSFAVPNILSYSSFDNDWIHMCIHQFLWKTKTNCSMVGIPTIFFFIFLPSRRAAGVIALDLEMAPVLARLCCGCCLAFFVVSLADRAEGLGLVVREIWPDAWLTLLVRFFPTWLTWTNGSFLAPLATKKM